MVNVSDIEVRVREVISSALSVDPSKVVLEASFTDDLDADSLDTVELVMALEDVFDCEIPEEIAEKIRTVGDVVKFITEIVEKQE